MKLLVNAPTGEQQIIEVDISGGYFDLSRVLWDERADGPMPAITLGCMVRAENGLEVDQGLLAALPAKQIDALRRDKKDRINEIKQAKLTGTIIVSGMNISLDTDSKAIMALAKTNSRASRKIHTHAGDRAILTTAQFDGLVAAIENYGQAVMDRAYDLSEALDAATTEEELNAIDVTAGWPQ